MTRRELIDQIDRLCKLMDETKKKIEGSEKSDAEYINLVNYFKLTSKVKPKIQNAIQSLKRELDEIENPPAKKIIETQDGICKECGKEHKSLSA